MAMNKYPTFRQYLGVVAPYVVSVVLAVLFLRFFNGLSVYQGRGWWHFLPSQYPSGTPSIVVFSPVILTYATIVCLVMLAWQIVDEILILRGLTALEATELEQELLRPTTTDSLN